MTKEEFFFKDIYRDNEFRLINKRNLKEDKKIFRYNLSLINEEKKLIEKYFSRSSFPKIFIVGAPRSGTTILYQLMASNYHLSYFPSAIAQYYVTPLTGFELKKIKSFKRELIGFKSRYGSVQGDWMPHEFGYYWQYRFLHNGTDELNTNQLDKIRWNWLNKEINTISAYFNLPIVIKSLPFINYKIQRIYNEIENSHFIYIKREDNKAIFSILNARLSNYGDLNRWWSIRPKNIKDLLKLNPFDQVINQYYSSIEKIDEGLKSIPHDRKKIIHFKDLIQNPKSTLDNLFYFINPINQEFRFEKTEKDTTNFNDENMQIIEDKLLLRNKSSI